MLTPHLSKSNLVAVLMALIDEYKTSISLCAIKKKFGEPSGLPDILGLSDCLTSWNIPNEVYKFEQ